MKSKSKGKGESKGESKGERKLHFAVRGMNEDGDYVTVKEFNSLSHAINFANTWKAMGKKKVPLLVVDTVRNVVAFRV